MASVAQSMVQVRLTVPGGDVAVVTLLMSPVLAVDKRERLSPVSENESPVEREIRPAAQPLPISEIRAE